jgi:hypothetical protein
MTGDNPIYWRYKKNKPPVDDQPELNGEVKIVRPARNLPPPFLCSKCTYNAPSRKDLNDHWLLEH